jgi:hypothetical protein
MSKIYVGDVGKIIRLDTDPQGLGIELATANTLKILVKNPDGTLDEWEASQYLETTQIQYITEEDDLDIKGTYKFQAYIAWDNPASEHKGETASIKVYEAFK